MRHQKTGAFDFELASQGFVTFFPCKLRWHESTTKPTDKEKGIHMRLRLLRRMTSLTILSFVFAANASAQLARIKTGYSSIALGQCLVWVAKEAGLFKENGLDVQLIFIGSSSIMTQAIIAGDVPMGIMSGSTAIGSQLAGGDLVIVASTKKDPAQAFLVTAKGISHPSQLKGKKLAVSRLGASSDFILRVILKKIGLVPDKDVAIIQIGSSPVRMAALANGVADGTALTFEEMMVAKKMGFNVLLNLLDLDVEALNSDVVTTRRFMRESRDTVQRFIKGMVKAVSVFGANKKFSMGVIARYTKSNDAEKIEYGYDYVAKIFLQKPYTPIKGIQLALEEIGERNPAAKKANPEQFIDMSIVKELDQSGYIDALYK
ncbi:MAG TPA: ABC transporter substrate-binding protein [Candidatus Acidoferrales bacterium]|nr:ABC transporter substrate-binding protein [Candidatus Acidoferrales bacterium]